MSDAEIDEYEARQKPKKFSVENSKHKTATGYIVRGYEGYHSGKIHRARPKVYVGCSENII